MIEVYVKDSAKKQLEQGGPDKWYTPLSFKSKPSIGYTCKLSITEEENCYDCIDFEKQKFYPDQHEDLLDVVERIEFVEAKSEEKPKPVRKEIKYGQEITMYFNCFGLTSEESVTIVDWDDNVIIIEDTWHDKNGIEDHGTFCRDTGKCLNDNNGFGGSRKIDPM